VNKRGVTFFPSLKKSIFILNPPILVKGATQGITNSGNANALLTLLKWCNIFNLANNPERMVTGPLVV